MVAVTEDGALVVASGSGDYVAAYGGVAGKLILVLARRRSCLPRHHLTRIQEISIPYEDSRLMAQMGVHTKLTRLLVIYGGMIPSRRTVILVREPVGI